MRESSVRHADTPIRMSRRRVLRKWGEIGITLFGGTLLAACSAPVAFEPPTRVAGSPIPRVEPTLSPDVVAEINRLTTDKEKARQERPDCFEPDVNRELLELSKGNDTYKPREIQVQGMERDAILQYRKTTRDVLQNSARTILATTDDAKQRSLLLVKTYLTIANIEVQGFEASRTSPSEYTEEMKYLAKCRLVKTTALNTDYLIDALKSGLIKPLPRPTATPEFPLV